MKKNARVKDENRRKRGERNKMKGKTLDEAFSTETEISCMYFHLSSITPRTLLVKKLPVN